MQWRKAAELVARLARASKDIFERGGSSARTRSRLCESIWSYLHLKHLLIQVQLHSQSVNRHKSRASLDGNLQQKKSGERSILGTLGVTRVALLNSPSKSQYCTDASRETCYKPVEMISHDSRLAATVLRLADLTFSLRTPSRLAKHRQSASSCICLTLRKCETHLGCTINSPRSRQRSRAFRAPLWVIFS